ncbi:hypothetical protein N8I77_012481 [Diaporthe amygdali]|uniref:Uncharacterized protein n=1 Tax=Phomopsis amygdali TaxID=1214568 RepID=A0AAD9S2V1_PHOAM|nr:hypothetical protein N8I77_012481 [Diaporthe amygdali]
MAKRRAITEVPTCMNGLAYKRHQSIDDSLIEGFAKLLSKRYLDDLPQEILLRIFQNFAESWVLTDDLADWEMYTLDRHSRARQQTLIALTKTCRRLNPPATSIMYRCAHLRKYRSVLYFLSSLRLQPTLVSLVKQVSCPHEVLMCLAYAFYSGAENLNRDWGTPTELIRRTSRPVGRSMPRDRQHMRWYDSYFHVAIHRKALNEILKRVPAIRALSIATCSPWQRSYPLSSQSLKHLEKLSICIPLEPEVDMRLQRSSYSILHWLKPSNLGQHPALKQLELIQPRGKWVAQLVTIKPSSGVESAGVEKYVESLTTFKRNGGGFAQWDLMSLKQSVFSTKYLHTLHYAGQSRTCTGACDRELPDHWNLNRFLATTGQGIRTLSLDWENDCVQYCQLGPTAMLTSLPMLANLTHLTVSMQVLFQRPDTCKLHIEAIMEDPEVALRRLLPASLLVLRISEFMPTVLQSRSGDHRTEEAYVRMYSRKVLHLIDALRIYWLGARADRELWFKYFLKLEQHPRYLNEPSRRILRWIVSHQRHQDVGREFARVWHS